MRTVSPRSRTDKRWVSRQRESCCENNDHEANAALHYFSRPKELFPRSFKSWALVFRVYMNSKLLGFVIRVGRPPHYYSNLSSGSGSLSFLFFFFSSCFRFIYSRHLYLKEMTAPRLPRLLTYVCIGSVLIIIIPLFFLDQFWYSHHPEAVSKLFRLCYTSDN